MKLSINIIESSIIHAYALKMLFEQHSSLRVSVSPDLENATLAAHIHLLAVTEIESHPNLAAFAHKQTIILHGNILDPKAEPLIDAGMPFIPTWQASPEGVESTVYSLFSRGLDRFTKPGANLQDGLSTLIKPGEQLLTLREASVLYRAAQADSNQLIAQRFGISVHTVKTHLSNGMRKLRVASRSLLRHTISEGPDQHD